VTHEDGEQDGLLDEEQVRGIVRDVRVRRALAVEEAHEAECAAGLGVAPDVAAAVALGRADLEGARDDHIQAVDDLPLAQHRLAGLGANLAGARAELLELCLRPLPEYRNPPQHSLHAGIVKAFTDSPRPLSYAGAMTPTTSFLRRALGLMAAVSGFALGVGAADAVAQTYPARPVRIIVPYPAGGAADAMARVIAERMSANWAPVIVEPKPGANGNIAADYVHQLPGDGYTLLVASGFLTVNPLLSPGLKWSHRSFVPVGLIGAGPPNVFVVPAGSPFKSLQDVARQAKAEPRKINVGTPSIGSSNHFGLEMFYNAAAIEIFSIPYTGAPPVVPAVLRGDVSLSLLSVPMVAPHVRGEKMKALAISSERRSKVLPEVPTIAEAGFPGAALMPWFGLVAPPGTPPEIVETANREMRKALATPEVVARMENIGAEILGGSAEDFQRHLAREAEAMTRLIKERNIRGE
jgi:tripartite-type tricarboxylate transporter receptor subunit TctC